MLSIRSSAEMARALSILVDPELCRLLALRRGQLLDTAEGELDEHAHFIVIQPGDTVATVEGELEFPIVADGDDPDFVAPFEWVARHGRWFEGVLILSDDGFATVLFIPDRAGIDPQLRRLIHEHA